MCFQRKIEAFCLHKTPGAVKSSRKVSQERLTWPEGNILDVSYDLTKDFLPKDSASMIFTEGHVRYTPPQMPPSASHSASNNNSALKSKCSSSISLDKSGKSENSICSLVCWALGATRCNKNTTNNMNLLFLNIIYCRSRVLKAFLSHELNIFCW